MMSISKKYVWMILGLVFGLSPSLFAQFDLVNKAQNYYSAKDFESGKRAIDSAMLSKEVLDDAQVWQVKAFIYYELSKKYDKFRLNSAYRDSSVRSALYSNTLKPTQQQKDYNRSIVKKQAEAYYNMCIKFLYDSLNYKNSSQAYGKYKESYSKIDSTFDFRAKDIEFNSAVGSQFSDLFNQNNSKTEYGEIGKVALMKVIELDPKNISANINLGIIYYNQGVNLINSMEVDTPLDKLEVIQDNSAKLFKQSLPFMNSVYQLDPKNLKALESLRQIYQALNEPEKSLEFNKKLEEAKKGQ